MNRREAASAPRLSRPVGSREWPTLPPDVHEAVVQALTEALVLDYRKRMVGSPAGNDHAPMNDGRAA